MGSLAYARGSEWRGSEWRGSEMARSVSVTRAPGGGQREIVTVDGFTS